MRVDDDFYSFAFRGLLAEEALDRAGRAVRLRNEPISEIESRLSIGLLDEEAVTAARRMAAVYTAIAAFENSVRDLIARKLLEECGADWWTSSVSEKIRNRAEARYREELKIKWHAQRGKSLLWYADFGDLAPIISQNWIKFENHLQDQDWVRHILDTIERSRNVIMHSGELENADVERIGGVIRDWIRQVGA